MQANLQLLTRALAFVGSLQLPFTESQTSDNIVICDRSFIVEGIIFNYSQGLSRTLIWGRLIEPHPCVLSVSWKQNSVCCCFCLNVLELLSSLFAVCTAALQCCEPFGICCLLSLASWIAVGYHRLYLMGRKTVADTIIEVLGRVILEGFISTAHCTL